MKVDNYFQVLDKNLDYRSNQNVFHVSLTEVVLFPLRPNSYSRQQICLEDAAIKIEDVCTTIPVSCKNIYDSSSNFIVRTYVFSLASLGIKFFTMIQCDVYLEAYHKGVRFSS